MIRLQGLTLSRGGTPLLDHADATIGPGERIALIGRNGAGKTTLLAALAGEMHPDTGDIVQPWRASIRLEQALPSSALPAWRFIVASDARLAAAAREIERAGHDGDGTALAHAHDQWQEAGGLDAEARCRALLAGLGFDAAQAEQPVDALSGGWRMRLNLARALFAPSELLLLDEPTNHLDLDAILWFERWLLRYPGTVIVVSHDRDFLDRVATATLHLDDGKLVRYAGGYSEFERLRAQRQLQAERARASYDARVAHLQAFITRFRAKATKARQAQSRIKALERMERIAAAHVDTPFSFAFRDAPPAPDPLLQIEDGAVGYGDKTVLERITLTLRPGERVGLLGRNGAGKSTLIKLLAHELQLATGRRLEGKGLATGYFAQHQLETLRPDESALQHMVRLDPQTREQELRDYLGGFDFRGDGVGGTSTPATTPCGPFSGGEKSRLALALLIWQRPNLLLLDEPTNHLDLEMRHALTLALQDYEGGMVIVSHDRALLRATCDRFLLVDDGRLQPFDGDLDDYKTWLAQRRAADATAAQCPDRAADKASRKADREAAAADRQARLAARRPLQKELDQLDKKLGPWNAEKAQLDERLADPALYTGPDAGEVPKLLKRQAELTGKIDEAELRWLELHEALEAIPAD